MINLQRFSVIEPIGHSIFALVLRLWVAQVFFMSGLTKIQSWSTTVMLFEYEYSVPLLSPMIAAYLATAAELVLPVLLVVGVLTRIGALGLFILNAVAVIAYADLSPAGVQQHMLWGVILAALVVYGAGKAAGDHWLWKRIESRFAN